MPAMKESERKEKEKNSGLKFLKEKAAREFLN